LKGLGTTGLLSLPVRFDGRVDGGSEKIVTIVFGDKNFAEHSFRLEISEMSQNR